MIKEESGWSTKYTLTAILMSLVIAAAASFGTYTWQHNKVTNLNNKVSGLNSQLTSLNNQISTLSDQLNKACGSTQQTAQPTNSCLGYSYKSTKGLSVLIFSPAKNAKVTSPLAVVGEVPGSWSTEAQFPVQLKDGQGKIIDQTAARILGNWMTDQLVPFSVQLTYTTPESGSGVLVLQKDNPSGLATNSDSVTIPVQF